MKPKILWAGFRLKSGKRLGFDNRTNGAVSLLENVATGEAALQHSLRIKLVGTKSNRDGIGTVVTLAAGGDVQSQVLKSGSSYLSASELVLTLGMSRHEMADSIEFRWPSGNIDRLRNVATGQTIVVTEGRGVSERRRYAGY